MQLGPMLPRAFAKIISLLASHLRFPQSLTNFSWENFLNESLDHKSSSLGQLLGNLTQDGNLMNASSELGNTPNFERKIFVFISSSHLETK